MKRLTSVALVALGLVYLPTVAWAKINYAPGADEAIGRCLTAIIVLVFLRLGLEL